MNHPQTRQELSASYAWLYRWGISGLLTGCAVLAIWFFAIRNNAWSNTASVAAGVALALGLMCIARVFDRAKRIWLDQQTLIINDYNKEITVRLDNIESASCTPLFWPHRITIRFAQPTAFGDRVSFFPRLRAPWSQEQAAILATLNSD